MPVRQFPRSLRARVRIAYAVAWEALINTHTEQARQFIEEFSNRVAPLEALELYLTVVPVAEAMREPVRTRTLTLLDIDCLPQQTPLPMLRGWRVLRPDLLLKLIRFRREYAEKTVELARLVGARAEEAIAATHVNNARQFTELLRDHLPVERAIGEYLRAFYLSLGAGQLVLQRVKSEAAGSQLAAQYASGPAPDPELLEPAEEELPEVQATEDAYTAPPSSALLG
ncbi:MAG: hypothetical protein ABI742_01405 [Gemmatimonadota bacterium]